MSTQEVGRPRSRSRWKVGRLATGGVIVVLYLSIIALVAAFEGRLIFPAPAQYVANTPEVAGLAFRDLHIPVDGKSYEHAWWIPSPQPNAKVIVYFHGNGEVLDEEGSREVPLFHQTGANLLMVEYRGYGSSSPRATTGVTMGEDARAAVRYLEQERHIPVSDIVICGWSIGTGVATQLAVETPGAAGLMLISPVASTADVANQSWLFRYLLRPSQWLRHDNDFDNKDKIGSIRMPVLIMTGTEDQIAPPWMARELYQRAGGPKTIQLIQGSDHNGIMENRDGISLRQMQKFVASLPAGAGI
ncbi:MAG: alpha/beta hydrolase [Acidobacteriaceae bacterium]